MNLVSQKTWQPGGVAYCAVTKPLKTSPLQPLVRIQNNLAEMVTG